MSKTVECPSHGPQPETFVCQHVVQSLRDGKPVGFFWSIEDPDAERPDAWCARCEEVVRQTAGEWTPEAEQFAGVKLLCGICYDAARALNFP